MAIQAQLYSENFGGPQDFLMESSYNNYGFDNLCFVPQHDQQQLMQFDIDHFQNSSPQKNNNNNNNNFLPRNTMNNDHHHHHQQQQQQQSVPVTAFSHGVAAHVEKQRMEFEQFIKLQNERLRIAIHHQRKQQISVLVKKYEYKARFLLTRKEEEIAKVGNRTMELQNFLKKMEMENQTWQRIANENESMVASLNSTIQRLRESASISPANNAAADDAESCCHNGASREAGEENAAAVCKCCGSRNSCVVMLPCRHLCSCKECEVFLDSCPVCKMVKKGSIEALIQ